MLLGPRINELSFSQSRARFRCFGGTFSPSRFHSTIVLGPMSDKVSSFDALVVHVPTSLVQQSRHRALAVAAVLPSKLDETTYSRELAPLAGANPSVLLGPVVFRQSCGHASLSRTSDRDGRSFTTPSASTTTPAHSLQSQRVMIWRGGSTAHF